MSRISTLPKRLQPMLATLTDGPLDDTGWIFEDKYDGFRMVAKVEGGKVTLYNRNGKIISNNYVMAFVMLLPHWREFATSQISPGEQSSYS